MKRFIQVGLALAVGATVAGAVGKYPFPRNASYAYGIKASNATDASVQAAYTSWLSRYKEGVCSDGSACARITFDDDSYTVSEGIGYGMLIMAYMDNATNNTQEKFDRLWNYYKASMNSHGLMNWKISGFSTSGCSGNNCNGATDGDLDAALALMMASKQWGDGSTDKYVTAAKTLIANIYKWEVASGLLGPGDGWGQNVSNWTNFYNPSYFSPAAVELFKKVNASDWSTVQTNNYALVAKNTAKSPSAGLPTNWCNANDGTPTVGTTQIGFNYDAVRTPWRMALAYAWYGHSEAKTIAGKMANWTAGAPINGSPANVKDGYNQDGSASGQWNVATFVGALGSAGMVDAKHQAWVNSSWSRLVSGADGSGYYHGSLKVLYMLTLSGNMNNFWDGSAPTPTASKFTVTTSATNGTIALSPVTGPYDSNSVVKATATPSAGYKFTGWTGACTGTGACNITMNANKTLGATFAATPKYTLTVSAGNGAIALSPAGGSYDSNTTVIATATAPTGYRLAAWTGACTGSSTCSITMNANKSLGATWELIPAATYVLTVNATNGKVLRSPDSASYSAGKVVTLTASADSTYKFSGWSGACSGTDTVCTVTMDAAKTVTASFAAQTYYTLSINATNGTISTSPAGPKYAAGSTVTLLATPNTGFVFGSWYNQCVTSTGNTCTIVVSYDNYWVGAGFNAGPVGIAHRLPNGERLVMSQGILSFDATGLGSSRLVVTDLQGRSSVLWQGQANAHQVSLQGVKPGVYHVRLEGESGRFAKLVQVLH